MQRSSNCDKSPHSNGDAQQHTDAFRVFIREQGELTERWHFPDAHSIPPDALDEILTAAADILRTGGLLIYPTDTLYALGASAIHEGAVHRLEELKGRTGMPISVTVHALDDAERFAVVTPSARSFSTKNLPGQYTLILPLLNSHDHSLAPQISAGTGTVGVRIPHCKIACEIARKAGIPITATSANLHGEGPASDIQTLLSKFGTQVAMIVYSGVLSGAASSLIDCTGDNPHCIERNPLIRSSGRLKKPF